MVRYSLDRVLSTAALESRFVLLGAIVGALLAGILYRTASLEFRFLNMETVEVALYGGIIGTASVLSLLPEKRYLIRCFMAIVIGCVAILLYWNALELFWLAPEKDYFLIGGLVPASDRCRNLQTY